MRVAIHQPQYWPWPRYLHKVMSADIFVYLDTVQFNKNGLQNRNKIKTSNGSAWLTLPVKQELGQKIRDTKLVQQEILKKHFKSVESSYAATPGFKMWKEEIYSFFNNQNTTSLCDIGINSTEYLLSKLNIGNKRIKASEIEGLTGEGSKLITNICENLNATFYLTGTGAIQYLNYNFFAEKGIQLLVQSWEPLIYEQNYPGIGFIKDLSALDLILNQPESAKDLIRRAGGWVDYEDHISNNRNSL